MSTVVKLLHPEAVAAALHFADDATMRRLQAFLADVGDPWTCAARTSEFLLREVGEAEILRRWKAYPNALDDAFAGMDVFGAGGAR